MMLALLVVVGLLQIASAATYIVGDDTEWTIPPSNTFYDDWAVKQNFVVGDKLSKISTPFHVSHFLPCLHCVLLHTDACSRSMFAKMGPSFGFYCSKDGL